MGESQVLGTYHLSPEPSYLVSTACLNFCYVLTLRFSSLYHSYGLALSPILDKWWWHDIALFSSDFLLKWVPDSGPLFIHLDVLPRSEIWNVPDTENQGHLETPSNLHSLQSQTRPLRH